MNSLNHFIFSLAFCLIFLELTPLNLFFIILFSFVFSVLIDLDHLFSKNKPWFRRRSWIQEPFGFLFLGLPIAIILSLFNKKFFLLVCIPYLTHILLDYFCVFETFPLAPFSRIKKREGMGLFIPSSKRWERRIKKGISEKYFLIFNFLFLLLILILKLFFSISP